MFTVCDNAADEVCPVWPDQLIDQPMTPHWGVPDPSLATGSAAELAFAFADAHRMPNQRIGIFINLPLSSLDKLTLQKWLDDIWSRAIGGTI